MRSCQKGNPVYALICGSLLASFLAATVAFGQATPEHLKDILSDENLSPAVSAFQVRQYLLNRIAPPPDPHSAEAWTAEAARIRQHLLGEVVFHGWPLDWVNSPPKFEETGVIETGHGYRIRKLRYEIVPGFYSAALLYEPDHLAGKVPAILNVNGHGPIGKFIEYQQKRCINYAQRGILALLLDWFWTGELVQEGNAHWYGAHLDFVGSDAAGLFYLEMRRGLDYLYNHPNVDRTRLGMTGLSGGGWQTIVLSSLDERIRLTMPVAGFSSLCSRIEAKRYGDLGDIEQSATDMFDGIDFTHLAAMMAPRPMQLAYNAEDDCCFRAGMVKPLVFDAILPIYQLYGKQDDLRWHENRDPGTHNYQQDNRETSYRFFDKYFGLAAPDTEIPVGPEVRSDEELTVGLPKDNQTILGLARQLGKGIERPPIPAATAERAAWAKSQRQVLAATVRYKPVKLSEAQAIGITKHLGVETKAFLFLMNNGLTANGVWLRAIGIGDRAPVTVILNDAGKKAAPREVAERINRGEQVLALDLLFIGDAWGKTSEAASYAQLLHGTGDRPLGLQAAQLTAITQWACRRAGAAQARLEITGIRNQLAGLVAAGLEPGLFTDVVVHQGMSSLAYVLEKPVWFQDAPELFCLDMDKKFDIDRLTLLAAPAQVTLERAFETPASQPK